MPEGAAGTISADLGLNATEYYKEIAKAKSSGLSAATSVETAWGSIAGLMKKAVAPLAAAFSAAYLISYIKDITMLAARVETLAVVLNVVGNNAGYTRAQLETLTKAVEKKGITTQAARQSLAMMAQAEMDLMKADQLARVAQDAAVIGNINSSEAFERMVYAVKTGQPEMLRTIGINVSFESSYSRLATQLRKSAGDLTEAEKTQARMNATLDYGARIVGTYEASLGTAGKAVLSLERYVEQVKYKMGESFQPAFKIIVDALTETFKDMGTGLDEFIASGKMKELATSIAQIVGSVVSVLGTMIKLITPIIAVVATFTDVIKALAYTGMLYLAQKTLLAVQALFLLNRELIVDKVIAFAYAIIGFASDVRYAGSAVEAFTIILKGLTASTVVGLLVTGLVYAIIKITDAFKGANEEAKEFRDNLMSMSATQFIAELDKLDVKLQGTIELQRELRREQVGKAGEKDKSIMLMENENVVKTMNSYNALITAKERFVGTKIEGVEGKEVEKLAMETQRWVVATNDISKEITKLNDKRKISGSLTEVELKRLALLEAELVRSDGVRQRMTASANKLQTTLEAIERTADERKLDREKATAKSTLDIENAKFAVSEARVKSGNEKILAEMRTRGATELQIARTTAEQANAEVDRQINHKRDAAKKEAEIKKLGGKDDSMTIAIELEGKLKVLEQERAQKHIEANAKISQAALTTAKDYISVMSKMYDDLNVLSEKSSSFQKQLIDIQFEREKAYATNKEELRAAEEVRDKRKAEVDLKQIDKLQSAWVDYYSQIGYYGEEFKDAQSKMWDAQAELASKAIGGIITKEQFRFMYEKKANNERLANDLEYYSSVLGDATKYIEVQDKIIQKQAEERAALSNVPVEKWKELLTVQEQLANNQSQLTYLEETNRKYSALADTIRKTLWEQEYAASKGIVGTGVSLEAFLLQKQKEFTMQRASDKLSYYGKVNMWASDSKDLMVKLSQDEYDKVLDITGSEVIARKAATDLLKEYQISAWKSTESAIDGVRAGILEMNVEAKTTAELMADLTKNALNDLADALTDFVMTGEIDMKRLADSIIRELIRIDMQKAITFATGGKEGTGMLSGLIGGISSLVGDLFGGGSTVPAVSPSAISGSLSSITGTGGGVSLMSMIGATKFHSGGTVGIDGKPVLLPSSLFDYAPKLHGGLGYDEYPAVLQRGEKVIPANQASAPPSKESGGNININIVAADAKSFEDMCKRNPSGIIGVINQGLKDRKLQDFWKTCGV